MEKNEIKVKAGKAGANVTWGKRWMLLEDFYVGLNADEKSILSKVKTKVLPIIAKIVSLRNK